jgi:AmiR/NasT family two-component response regulator
VTDTAVRYDVGLASGSPAERDRLRELTHTLLERNAQLQQALDSRVVIEQAKGVLAERLGVDVEEAFTIIRSAARSNHVKLHELAAEVVGSRETPSALDRQRGSRAG